MKIGFFDSGLGGRLVMDETAKLLPLYDYVFYGDTANVPYGSKSEEEIYGLLVSGAEELFKKDCAIIIVACNTASVTALRRFQDEYLPGSHPQKRALGVVIPSVEEIERLSPERLLIVATERTCASGKYPRVMENRGIKTRVFQAPSKNMAGLIEEGRITEAEDELKKILDDNFSFKPDTVLLGCTHYAKIKDTCRRLVGESVNVLSQDEIIGKKLQDYLNRHSSFEVSLTKNGTREYFFSGPEVK